MRIVLLFVLLAACADTSKDNGPLEEDLRRAKILSAQWTELPNAPSINGKQDDLFFVDAARGWSVNGLGEIHTTEDGGDTWRQVADQPGTYFRAILMLDEQRGFAGNIGTDYFPGVTDEQPLYGTSDGGETWTAVTNITGPTPKGICNFTRAGDHLFGLGRVGGPSFLLHSSDAGESWTSRDLSEHIAMLIDGRFTSATEGIIVGGTSTDITQSSCVILHTSDGGETWTERFRSSRAQELCWKIAFPSDKAGYVSVQSFGSTSSFVKTIDGGVTWSALPFAEGRYNAKGIGFITPDIGWIGGETTGKPAYRTTDGGISWEPDASLGPLINRFRFVDDRTAYAIGMSIYKLEVPE